jgi:transposase-like protein
VLTDGATYFPEVIKEIFPNAKQQRCLIHILRNLYPHLIPQRQVYYGAIKKEQKTRKIYRELKNTHKERLKTKDALKHKLKYWKDKRIDTQTTLGVKPYQKNINRLYPELKSIYDTINFIQTQLNSLNKTLLHDKERLPLLDEDITQAKRWKNTAWNLYMASINVLYGFYNLFRQSPKTFEAKREHYLMNLIDKPATELIKAILDILSDVKEVSTVFMADCPVRLNRNFINTNVIESINSRLRPVLDKMKKLHDTSYLRAILEIVRLRLNTSRPYSGRRTDQSPIERCGYNLKSRTWLDLIMEGLPPGTQPQKNLLRDDLILNSSNHFLEIKSH